MASIIIDRDELPGHRTENCFNCKYDWGAHLGWRCPTMKNVLRNQKSELAPNERYLSSDMKDEEDNSKPVSYICPCGIHRQNCDYHK